ncbi:fibronectin type III domain-containing protein [Actinoplanes sp. NPDC049265]|uniref:fibronectin type III domain-containing protein n=1 Tax=Actinoplanes sp. NPDC049265 TaxID=3363902 RepID=UPI0037105A53
MPAWLTRGRVGGALAIVLVLAVVTVPVVFAPSVPAKALNFLQAGHWVLNKRLKTIFHIHGGAKDVDAKVAAPGIANGGLVVQGDKYGFVVDGTQIVGFGKSDLTVSGAVTTGPGEQPIALEVPGGPYLVYRTAGSLVRLGIPALTVQVGGPVTSAVATSDGTVWVRRSDTGAVCSLDVTAQRFRCGGRNSAAGPSALTVVNDRVGLLDPVAGTLAMLTGNDLGAAVRVMDGAPGAAEVASNDAAGRLPVLAGRRLVLADTSWVARGGAKAAGAISVDLGAGTFRSPVATDRSVSVLDTAHARLMTFRTDGTGRRSTAVAPPAADVRLTRSGDGRVYVDDADGAHSLVVDTDGQVTRVTVGGTDVPTRPRPQNTDEAPDPVRPPSNNDGSNDKGDEPKSGTKPPKTNRPGGNGPKTNRPPKTPAKAPGAPGRVTAQPGDAQATVAWQAAAANGSALTAYDISWVEAGGTAPAGSTSVSGRTRTAVVPGLTNGTTYVFTVIARNGVGAGPPGTSAPVMPSADVPSAPERVTATAGTDGTIAVSWAAANGQGHAITGYTVTAGSGGGSQVVASPTGTSATVTLTAGVPYTFTVTATNDLGLTSAASAASEPAAAYAPAGAPGDLKAEVSDGTVKLTWAEPDLGGGDLVHYVIAGDLDRTTTDRSAEFTGLTNGREYTVTVRAVTRGKTSPTTVEGATATASAKPGTVPSVALESVTLTGDRTVTVRVAVDERSSGAVTCQLIFNGTQVWSGGCSGTQDIPIGGLAYGTDYDVYVQPGNSFGLGRVSEHRGVHTNEAPTVTVSKGARHTAADCTSSACAWVVVSARNLPASTSYTITCRAPTEEGGYYHWTQSTDGSGSLTVTSGRCYYGFPGRAVWVTVGGFESNHLTW